jgi:hypothetical protein
MPGTQPAQEDGCTDHLLIHLRIHPPVRSSIAPAAGVGSSARKGGAEALMAGLGCTHPDSNRWVYPRCVCVCVCVCVGGRACVRACVRVCVAGGRGVGRAMEMASREGETHQHVGRQECAAEVSRQDGRTGLHIPRQQQIGLPGGGGLACVGWVVRWVGVLTTLSG